MEGILSQLITATLSGGWGGIIAILLTVIGALVMAVREQKEQVKEKDDEIQELLEKQQNLLDRLAEVQRNSTDRYEALLRSRRSCDDDKA